MRFDNSHNHLPELANIRLILIIIIPCYTLD